MTDAEAWSPPSDRPALATIGQDEGEHHMLGHLSTVFKAYADWTDNGYCIVEQPIAPGLLVTPHMHSREDQLAYVIEGTLGFKVGDEEVEAPAGSFVYRARGVPHANWNATDEPARMLEITSPGHFEDYFRRFGALTASGQSDPEAVRALGSEFGVSFIDDWIPYLSEKYGVSTVPR